MEMAPRRTDTSDFAVANEAPGLDTFMVALFLAACVDGGLLVWSSRHPALIWLALTAHVAMLGFAAAWLVRRRVDDISVSAIGLIAVIVAGPLGGACLLILELAKAAHSPRAPSDTWYHRVATQDALDMRFDVAQAIRSGRAFEPNGRCPIRVLDVIAAGTLREKQALLGTIALNYHNDYLPVLLQALRANEASVRAQAAAVYVKLKEHFVALLRQNMSLLEIVHDDDASGAIVHATSILDVTDSGFIDAVEVTQARSSVRTICERVLARESCPKAEALLWRALSADGQHEQIALRAARRPVHAGRHLETTLAHCLMALGRHKELRELLQSRKATEMQSNVAR